MKSTRSKALFKAAQSVIPGGVNSPVRAFRSVGGNPHFIQKAKGAILKDVDGNTFIDYVLSWGPMILGHAHPRVEKAIKKATRLGTSYGAPCPDEVELAKLIVKLVPSIEQVRLVNSGTEAVMSAIRLARAFTKRDAILKFEGCYHGHADHLLVKAGSGVATLGIPDSPGVPASFARHTVTAPYNDITATEKLIRQHAKNLAAVIVEPVAGNMGVVPPTKEFLPWLRKITKKFGIVLIFDEVITGFRVGLGGAQARYNVLPDLTCLGKIIGGGLPIGAYGGKKDLMRMIAPSGPVYQAGTLSGNPVAVAAGLETLRCLSKPGVYKQVEKKSQKIAEGLGQAANEAKIPFYQTRVGAMLGGFFTKGPVRDFASAKSADTQRYAKFFHGMLEKGIYLAPSQFEAMLVSTVHTPSQIKKTIHAAHEVFHSLR